MVFGLPYLSLNLLKINIDIYYLIFLAFAVAFLWLYRRFSGLKIRASLKSGWALGIILALFVGSTLVSAGMTESSALTRSYQNIDIDITVILWRGIIYGLISGILVSAFPFIATWRALAGTNPGNLRKAGVILTAALAIILTSFSYSVGMAGFNMDKIEKQVEINIIAGLPTLISGNPMASPLAGVFLHVSRSLLEPDNNSIETVIKNSQAGGVD